MGLVVVVASGTVTAQGKVQYHVGRRYKHDQKCFTEGLFLDAAGGEVLESCGLTGRSYLRRYNLETGSTLQLGRVPVDRFGEGISRLGGSLYLLTYLKHEIIEYDALTLVENRRHNFPHGQGWGLTTDGCDLLATTGSHFIYRLRVVGGVPELVKKVKVIWRGRAQARLNELEYVTPKLWVNIWGVNTLLRVDPATGVAEAELDLGGLFAWRGEQTPNGIAYSVGLKSTSLIVTGKLWPEMFELGLSTVDLCGGAEGTIAGGTEICPQAPASACWKPAMVTTSALPSATLDAPLTPLVTQVPAAANDALLSSGASQPSDPPHVAQVPAAANKALPSSGASQPSDRPHVALLPRGFTTAGAMLSAAFAAAAMASVVCIGWQRQHNPLQQEEGGAELAAPPAAGGGAAVLGRARGALE